MWLDEAASVDQARSRLGDLWRVVSGADPNMGLYYVLLHGWMIPFGTGEAAVRSLTAIAAGLGVGIVALLGTRLFGRPAGLAAGLLLALDGFFVHYAQTARSYALLVGLVALSSYLFVVELERPSRASRVGYVLVSAAAVYAHYFAGLVVLAHLVTLLAVRRRGALTREWAATGTALFALCVPAAVFAARAGRGGISWIPQPRLQDLVDLPMQLTGGSRLLGWALLALAAYAVARAVGDRTRWRTGIVAVWLVLPVVVAFSFSFVQPVFRPYYLLVVLPALMLLAGAGLARLPGRILGVAALGALAFVSADRLSAWYSAPSEEDFRAATSYVLKTARAGDRLAAYPGFALRPIRYYEGRAAVPGPPVVEAPQTPASGRLWLVMRESNTPPKTERELTAGVARARPPVAGVRRFSGVLVALYGPPSR
jgi:mannosyltransferase